MHDVFLRFSAAKLRQFEQRIEVCLGQMTEEQIWWRGAEAQNAAGNLVLHLCGNLRQWILSAVGGEPDARRRDEEFAARSGAPGTELTARLRDVVDETARLIESLPAERLEERVRVQSYDVTVLEAVYHVVEHFAQHTGQIVYIAKLLNGRDLGFYAHLSKAAHSEPTP